MTSLLKALVLTPLFFSATLAMATYEIPSQNGNLAYPMPVKFQQDGLRVMIDFVLPLELTGTVNHIQAQGHLVAPDKAFLEGPNSLMTCHLSQRFCSVQYKNVSVDFGALQHHLHRQGFSEMETEQRLQITRRFQADPIGIVRF